MEVQGTQETELKALTQDVECNVTGRPGHGKAGYYSPWHVIRFQKFGMDEPVILVASGE
ncbi:MAG: hypothetical protein JWM59_5120 [Verrucomicrobiales bacterium]|nr:hypothetical protein [Verrucomicrobiales bacterium]